MNTLSRDEIIKAVTEIKNGRMERIVYQSELPLKAPVLGEGYKIIKTTETTGRFGINYFNVTSVIKRKNLMSKENPRKYTNNYKWVIKDKVKYNARTGKEYVVMFTLRKGHNTKISYTVYNNNNIVAQDVETLSEEYRNLVPDYYWKKENKISEIKTICFENIIRIGKIGEK